MVKKQVLLIFLMCFFLITNAQNCFVQTQTDRKEVYVQQPFRVTITVLTATWYTAPLVFDQLQVPNAFIMPFDRTVPGMFQVNGKQYAGLQFYFIVFPFKAGHYTLPAIPITAETPAVGDYKGEKIKLTTQPLTYTVKPFPKSFTSADWFVAKEVDIAQRWSKPLNKLKVGDVINRTLTINAKGTLPQFIPELKTDTLDWAGVYPGKTTLTDTRDEFEANGKRIQTTNILLEKTGDFVFPALSINWLNPVNSIIYQRLIPSVKVHVAANPNLGMLRTLKDSLAAKQPITTALKKNHHTIFGLPWYKFVLYQLGLIAVLYLLFRLGLYSSRVIKERHHLYLNSENYWFSQFKRSPLELSVLLVHLYRWWDHLSIPQKPASIQEAVKKGSFSSINQQLKAYYNWLYKSDSPAAAANQDFKQNISRYRKSLKKNKRPLKNINVHQLEWESSL